MSDIVEKIFAALGGEAVLLPGPDRQKGVFYEGWQSITFAQTQDRKFSLRFFRGEGVERKMAREALYCDELSAAIARGGNISVLLKGGLCAIDIDLDTDVEPFLALNPGLRNTLITRGQHGVQIWVRCDDDESLSAHGLPSWPKMYPLTIDDGRPREKDGKPTNGWGEWRADTVKSTIWGVHPCGKNYEWISPGPVVHIHWRDIRWPAGVSRPWEREIVEGLIRRWGPPWMVATGENGATRVDKTTDVFWAAWTALHHDIIFEAREERFYVYDSATGVWVRRLDEEVMRLIGDDLMDASRSGVFREMVGGGGGPSWAQIEVGGLAALQTQVGRSVGKLGAICLALKSITARRDVFNPPIGVVHARNAMVDLRPVLSGGDPVLRPFSPRWYSRNQIPVPFDAAATCHELQARLLGPGYTPDEQKMLQRWSGQCVLGRNKQQVLMIVTGNAGGGKSTLMKLLEKFIGEKNVMELRTKQLDERFEMSFYVGRTFLAGVDVDGNFLQYSAASALKKLTGDDLLHAEAKGAKDALEFRGNLNIGITCNSRLRVRLKSDHDAWRRRLCIAQCHAPRPAERIEEMEKWLLDREGPGILNWALTGAVEVLRGQPIRFSAALDKAVDDLINESDSVHVFVKEALKRERGSGIPNKIIYGHYIAFCEGRNWEALSENDFARAVRPLMSEEFSASLSSSVKDPETGRECKGYRGVAWKDDAAVQGLHAEAAAALREPLPDDDGEVI